MTKCSLIKINNTFQSTESNKHNGTDDHNLLRTHQMQQQTNHYI